MMTRWLSSAFMLLTLSGCGVLGHMDQITMMGEYSRDKNVQHKIVDDAATGYTRLTAVIKAGKIKDYPDKNAILLNFGEPIARAAVPEGEQWLYRQAIPQRAKDKVYLYFNHKNQLTRFEQEDIQWQ